jgi:hypothetical protein
MNTTTTWKSVMTALGGVAVGLAMSSVLCNKQSAPPKPAAEGKAKREEKKSQTARLTYFSGRGRGEQARWMLAATGIEFENVCLETPEEFAKMKKDDMLLFGQLPLLEVDGLRLVQSQSINRYLARRAGLYGKTDQDRLAHTL